jgi:TetR/AcrR family transcriptional regulator of autoinduction and epiphytic fitness
MYRTLTLAIQVLLSQNSSVERKRFTAIRQRLEAIAWLGASQEKTATTLDNIEMVGGAMIDPRVERSRQLILQAALDELGEVGYGTFRTESVAARAGVGKSTIYRHWPDKLVLIADAFETFHVQMVPSTEELSPRERVHSLVRHVAEVFVDSTFSVCIPALIEGAERDDRLRQFHHKYSAERRQGLIDVIAEGVASGDLSADLDPELAALALLGPIIYCRLMSGEPFEPCRANDLVEIVLGPP